eukprot:TRINITY_DN56908_c0_g1_i1.p1 TRINITY_DN56908_c0_g1~~TRINITY_DN56908_c0_g1_i1.p1  ORF type:complete len:510 (-),score=76.04 TRINITY_DN56908_c0_g1_i1:60-1589(-)
MIDDALLHEEDLTNSEHAASTSQEHRSAHCCGEGPVTILAACSRAPKWTIAGRSKSSSRQGTVAPGPGSYDVLVAEQAVLRQRPHATIPQADAALASNDSPGPDFDLSRTNAPRTKGGVVASVGRDFELGDKETPGPGAYLGLCSTLSPKGVAAIGEPPCRRRPDSAPPGGRRERLSSTGRGRRAEGPSWSFPQNRRLVMGTGGAAGDVGAEYMPPSTLKKTGASCRNGHHAPLAAQGVFEMRPDPLTYSPSMPAHLRESSKQSFTRAARPSSAPLRQTLDPGPGSYSVPDLARKGLAKISDSPARLASKEDQPGPGDYSPDARRLRSGGGNETTFARATRDVAAKPDQAPGAFALLRRALMAKTAAAQAGSGGQPAVTSSTLRSRGPRLPPRSLPVSSRRSPGSGAGGRVATAGSRGPGPGAFNTSRNIGGKQGCKFGKASRLPQQQADEGPGPGSYSTELRKSIKGGKLRPASASRASSSPASCRGTPGPGDYKAYSLFPACDDRRA